MKIGIDARMYGPKQGGLGRYVQQLVLNLERCVPRGEFVIFLRKENWDEYIPTQKNFKKVLADIPWYGWKEQYALPQILKKHSVDLMHFPHWNVPITYARPFVTTIHDLLLLHHPTHEASRLGLVSYWFKNNAYRIALNHAVKKARHLLTVSEFTQHDLCQTFKLPKETITVTPLAPFLTAETTPSTTHSADTILKKYHLTPPYVLYVGVAYPHKNLTGLLQAWKLYSENYHPAEKLVLVGKKNFFYEQLLNQPLARSLSNILYTDFVPDDELSTIYSHASLYIMPSFYEGSALPSLEALANHIPVISSNQTCLPEILQNAALYFDPQNTAEMSRAIHQGLTNKEFRKTSIERGKIISSQHSWKEVSEKTLAVYKKMVS